MQVAGLRGPRSEIVAFIIILFSRALSCSFSLQQPDGILGWLVGMSTVKQEFEVSSQSMFPSPLPFTTMYFKVELLRLGNPRTSLYYSSFPPLEGSRL